MEILKPLMEDNRPILLIQFKGEGGGIIRVGDSSGTTRIVAYGEPGECCYVPWFAVFVGEDVTRRVNAADIGIVEYAK